MKRHLPLFIIQTFFVVFIACNPAKDRATVEATLADSVETQFDSPKLKAVNKEILDNPSSADLYHKRAKIYYSLKKFSEAINDCKRAIRIDSVSENYYITLVDVYFSNNNTRLAKELLEICEKRFPGNTEILLRLGELYLLVKQYQKSIEYVNKALKIDENLARAYYIKGNVYRESGDTGRAISSLETATEQDNNYKDAFYDLGVIYAARRNPLALQYYENALRISPKDVAARYARAKFLQDVGKTTEAITEYEAVLNDGEKCENCLYNLGAIYLEVKKDQKKALDYFSRAITAEPAYLEAYYARAYTYSLLGDAAAARADYEMCLKLKPDFDEAATALNALK